MTKLIVISLITFLIIGLQKSSGQILISLLFGDKLNSDKIEFGLDGGLAISNINGLPGTDNRSSLHLGFYFDFKVEQDLYIHTGVLVNSLMGCKGIEPYPTGDMDLDQLLKGGSVKRQLNYFNVPIYVKYKAFDQFFFEAGPQLGLLYKAEDEFSAKVEDGEVLYDNNIKDLYKTFDLGMSIGAGYKLMQGAGLNLGVRYYYGLLNVNNDNTGDSQRNRVFYIFVGIPIGAGKANKN